MNKAAAMVLASALLAGVAFADGGGAEDPVTGKAQPDATVQLKGGSVATGIGYVWGHGTLDYQSKPHRFSISGLSIVDVGAASITATGNVYHLANLNDFAGNYVEVTAGMTVGGGGSAAYLKNEHGVVIKLTSTTVGLRFNLSANGVAVRLKS